jgi:homogentisate 1,2-dioxygenase
MNVLYFNIDLVKSANLLYSSAINFNQGMLMSDQTIRYQTGFGNEFATEALPGSLPQGQNSPQVCAHGLYAEQISGTAFTAPRHQNRRTWTYRIRPAAVHQPFQQIGNGLIVSDFNQIPATPNQLRWNPPPMPAEATDFIAGWATMAGNGSPDAGSGMAVHLYAANADMGSRYFYNADGELLIVPQQGRLRIATELGVLEIEPQEIAVIPRGIRFQVSLPDGSARGYVCENYGAHFRLPDLGVIGSNGLANPRDFQVPVAAFEDREGEFQLIAKFSGNLWRAEIGHCPLDVVAWHGNFVPYKYDLRHYNTIGSISYDHPDPSIFLVLQAPSTAPGVDVIDFVIFPPRWLAAENTFRPPWFHRNIASEFMGLVHGEYDAKAEGFVPGGSSLHNTMSGHGPDTGTFTKASASDTRTPHKVSDTMAFMFESCHIMRPTRYALNSPQLQKNYSDCWQDLPKNFKPN